MQSLFATHHRGEPRNVGRSAAPGGRVGRWSLHRERNPLRTENHAGSTAAELAPACEARAIEVLPPCLGGRPS